MIRESKNYTVSLNGQNCYMDTVRYIPVFDTHNDMCQLNSNCMIEISLVLSGMGFHRILNQEIPCQTGDLYVVNSNVLHEYYASPQGTTMTVRRLLFSPEEWLNGKYAFRSEPDFLYGCLRENGIMAYAMLTQAARESIECILDEIVFEYLEQMDEWKEAIGARLVSLLIYIARYANRAEKDVSQTIFRAWDPVSNVITMVRENYSNADLTLESISESFHFSRAHLSKLFKQITGETFSAYLKNVRFENACSMLTKTDKTVEEIMFACGMRDESSFYKSFSEYCGMTPNNYRKLHQKEHQKMNILIEISEQLQKGKGKVIEELVQRAIDEGISPQIILNDGLLNGMSVIGEKFRNNEVFVPEVLIAARAMNKGMMVLKPYLMATGLRAKGKVCIGTVQGDLHDIGKNLVKMMMEGRGLEVIDLGVDVAPEVFVQTAVQENCQIICLSSLLTSTMHAMKDVVNQTIEAGIRDHVKIMIGGAPVSEDFCNEIGADRYTPDAATAAEVAVEFCQSDCEQ